MSLVCWSGGCDSTLVLLRLLKESSAEKPVRTISFSLPPQLVQGDQQLMTRTRLFNKFKAAGFHQNHSEIRLETEGQVWIACNTCPQPPLWLAFAVPHLKAEEDLYVGWVRHDDIWHKLALVHGAFTHLQGIVENSGKLICPLEWETKEKVLQELKNEGYLDDCWWCENPKGFHQCGECHPCLRHAKALLEVK